MHETTFLIKISVRFGHLQARTHSWSSRTTFKDWIESIVLRTHTFVDSSVALVKSRDLTSITDTRKQKKHDDEYRDAFQLSLSSGLMLDTWMLEPVDGYAVWRENLLFNIQPCRTPPIMTLPKPETLHPIGSGSTSGRRNIKTYSPHPT